jgi:glyoxylase-like metal-dependent hydrolase (beta-lactamase superfamily II)
MLEIISLTLGPAQTNAYLLGDPDTGAAISIDPAWDGPRILAAAHARGWRVTNIWLTHGHFDHLGGAAAVADGSQPPPPVALHPDDYWWWRNEGGAAFFGMRIDPGPEPTIDLYHGMLMQFGQARIEVRHAPGHTRGHVMFHIPAIATLFCGDVIFQGSIGRTDLPGGDYETLIASIHAQVLTLPDETRLLSGHGAPTTVGQERRTNPFLVQ